MLNKIGHCFPILNVSCLRTMNGRAISWYVLGLKVALLRGGASIQDIVGEKGLTV